MDFKPLFEPTSIAIIGASEREGSVGNDLVKNLQAGFSGSLYPVNPKTRELLGLTCYPSVKDIPEIVDLAIIAIPAVAVPSVLREWRREKSTVCSSSLIRFQRKRARWCSTGDGADRNRKHR
ncbi:MAG: CoA-binding protein [Candidatus Moraniibacteriota bacterium]